MSMVALLEKILHMLTHPNKNDEIKKCPPSVLHLLLTRPDALINLAHTKLHTYPFASVPACWFRLYTDASISLAMNIIKESLIAAERSGHHRPDEEVHGEASEEWIGEVVRILDMAIIMAGAKERREIIDTLIGALQDHVEEHQPRRGKRIKVEDAFPVDLGASNRAPLLRYPVRSSASMTISEFERFTVMESIPVVLRDGLTHWPALHERPWSSPAYLMRKTFGGRRLIPVEVGRSYTDEGWGQSIITFREFMDKYMLRDKIEGSSGLGYLAQYDLFAQIPSLRNDIAIPDHCYTEMAYVEGSGVAKLEEPIINAWFGPAGTISPLHHDPYHNILCQVVGKKYVRLYNRGETEKLYPRGIEEGGVNMGNTSAVDVEAEDDVMEALFPRFHEARYVETILSEGECLYIPIGWWHYVRSLTVSFSVSFWWN